MRHSDSWLPHPLAVSSRELVVQTKSASWDHRQAMTMKEKLASVAP
jgi:hypothetical protein